MLTQVVLGDEPDRPVAALCALSGCHYREKEAADATLRTLRAQIQGVIEDWRRIPLQRAAFASCADELAALLSALPPDQETS